MNTISLEKIERKLLEIMAHLSREARLQMDVGENVRPQSLTDHFRHVFLHTLFELEPGTTWDLTGPSTYELRRRLIDVLAEVHAGISRDLGEDYYSSNPREYYAVLDASLIASAAFASVMDDCHGVIQTWQRDYCLQDEWIAEAALFTLSLAAAMEELGQAYLFPLNYLEVPSEPTPTPVFLDDLEGLLPLASSKGILGSYDPSTETIADAAERLLKKLHPLIYQRLELIASEDQQENGAIEPVAFRKVTAFEWLVRYQVFGASRAGIARELAEERGKDEHTYRSHVGREIRKVANLIGLTLRDASK